MADSVQQAYRNLICRDDIIAVIDGPVFSEYTVSNIVKNCVFALNKNSGIYINKLKIKFIDNRYIVKCRDIRFVPL